ncbi:MAG TPA: arsinothricin resistance N-acetyltransferase ArsN1 family B [Rhodanobacteraceae bacterium]|nr:arsinothricin resistance N-acetyltransferase ArsN1 family B [Rhodanobacteraceae bacterium]
MRAPTTGGTMLIRPILPADAERICEIYNHYVTKTIVTFEERPVTADEMRARIDAVADKFPWLVLERDGGIAGYAYAAPWKARIGYRFSVESSIYFAPEYVGHGFGSVLYGALLRALPPLGIQCVIGGAALPNPGSVALHEKLGFSKVAHFRRVGRKFDRWIDVGYWQLMLQGFGGDAAIAGAG